jgi:hypothetical protein
VISVVALVAAIHGSPALVGAKIPIDAVVVRVDKRHHRATIKYAALDTAPAGVRSVAIADVRTIRHLWVGESIHCVADTSRTPWLVSNIVEMR